ncbi:hypothetical protein [Cyanobium sp. LEGE 06113]|uniref:hypothetical protein n=1 Tax=Cyanobium sp. LEGE 06113 TaxID=1297573 RepID=UPI00187F79E4|nr:hypothetical protein [Cyanobium sp. LEGE 06113]MBE9154321.1 hypothetical protein [Cyanobium sp. LEGE 06113]
MGGTVEERTAATIELDGRKLFRIWPSSNLSAEQRSEAINQQLAQAAEAQGALTLELRRANNLPVLVLNDRTLLRVTERDVAEGLEAMEQAEAWRQQLERALARARAERRPDHLRRRLPALLAVLALAAASHWALQTFWRRRFPDAWALQSEGQGERQRRGSRFLQRAALLLLQTGVWIAALV